MASFVSRPVIGPLAPFAEGFIAQLANLSYSTQAVKSHRRLLVHLSQWLAERGLGVRELTPEVSAKFLQMRRDVGFVTKVFDVKHYCLCMSISLAALKDGGVAPE